MDPSSLKIQPKSKPKLSVPLFDSPPRSHHRPLYGGGSDGDYGGKGTITDYPSPPRRSSGGFGDHTYGASSDGAYGGTDGRINYPSPPRRSSGGFGDHTYGGGSDGGYGGTGGRINYPSPPRRSSGGYGDHTYGGGSDGGYGGYPSPPRRLSGGYDDHTYGGGSDISSDYILKARRKINTSPSPPHLSYGGYTYGGGGSDYGGIGKRIVSPPPPPPPPRGLYGDRIYAGENDAPISLANDPISPKLKTSFSKKDIVVDPDGGSSSLCSGCRLPIFSTPSISIFDGGEQLFLHDQCTRLPENLVHELHPHHTLTLLNQPPNSTVDCRNCNEICGTLLYQCVDPNCGFRLDLLCASQIRVVHRSHNHSMLAIRQRGSSSVTCGACDTKHESESETESETATISYLCSLCGFWIHPDCASLPNAILHYEEHEHSLFLTYNIIPSAADYSKCVICEGVPKRSSGVYFCLKCPNYVVHIRCALTRPKSFKPVFIRDAQVADLGRLPMPDEHTSLIPYMRESTAATAAVDDHYQSKLHSHPLIFHKIDEGDPSISSVCNACVQPISSPPFFSCSHCPNFSLHSCCADLPTEIEHPAHKHTLSLSSNAPKSGISRSFYCDGCRLPCNGFSYSCNTCNDMRLDVICALINPTITHESHNSTHILFMSRSMAFGIDRCNCCDSILYGIRYECSICRNFKLHMRCALLPTTVRHVFDKHPLQLTTTTAAAASAADEFCEVCEQRLEKRYWHYSCCECDQSFHVDCISSVDRLSRIKLGFTVRVNGHGCAVALVRERDAVCGGRRCGFCGEKFKFSNDGLVYECSDCFFGVHNFCAQKCLLKS